MTQAQPKTTLLTKKGVLKDLTLLVADDDEETLDLLKEYIKETGWSGTYVTSATGIIDAVNDQWAVEGTNFDAIVADINYWKSDVQPSITGITAARQIRKVLPDIPIIFISGMTNSVLREEVRRVKGELFVKPFDYAKLMKKVSQLVEWHRLSRVSKQETGTERRARSINQTTHLRRTTDTDKLAPSPIIESIIEDIKKERSDERRKSAINASPSGDAGSQSRKDIDSQYS